MLTIPISHLLLIILMVICIFTDLKSRRIYNWVLVPFLLAGLIAAFSMGGWNGLFEGLKGFIIGLLLLLIPFAKGGLGGGDVKLLAVIGSLMGTSFVLNTFLFGAIAGGIMAFGLLVVHKRLLATLSHFFFAASVRLFGYSAWVPGPPAGQEATKPLFLPYSLAIGAGAAFSYLGTSVFPG